MTLRRLSGDVIVDYQSTNCTNTKQISFVIWKER